MADDDMAPRVSGQRWLNEVRTTVDRWGVRAAAAITKSMFNRGTGSIRKGQMRHAPSVGIASVIDECYRQGDPDAHLDVYYPDHIFDGQRLPVVFWIHGGGWLAGDKGHNQPYFWMIANRGYTVVAVNYSLAPTVRYPEAIVQVNAALAHLTYHANRLHCDMSRVVIGGDSAGAQLTSQLATMVTNPVFAAEMGLDLALAPGQLKGVLLNCGIFDVDSPPLGAVGTPFGHRAADLGVALLLWAYTGTRGGNQVARTQMSTIKHVTKHFPPTWISGGNADVLTNRQSRPFADQLEALGVPVTTLFWPDAYRPMLPHQYQFQLHRLDAHTALESMLTFLDERCGAHAREYLPGASI